MGIISSRQRLASWCAQMAMMRGQKMGRGVRAASDSGRSTMMDADTCNISDRCKSFVSATHAVIIIAFLLVPIGSIRAQQQAKPDKPNCAMSDAKLPSAPDCMSITTGLSIVGKAPWYEFDQHIKPARVVAAHGMDLLGDQVNLQDGTLSFAATDISVPGNNVLPVAFRRTYSLYNREYMLSDEMLADWEVDVPRLSGTFASSWVDRNGSMSGRCSVGGVPPGPIPPSGGAEPSETSMAFWQGLQLTIPGISNGELMPALPGTTRPASGGPYPWVTNERVHVACLSTIKNGTGQGFLAIAPDGTRYWFDWMAQYYLPPSHQVSPPIGGKPIKWSFARRKNVLYATRVEDRFGNWVTYTYTNTWNMPGRLAEINASDGRKIVIAYSGAYIASVQAVNTGAGTRTWAYTYQPTTSGRDSLASVVLPDGTRWTIGFGQFTNAEIRYLKHYPPGEPVRSCEGLEMSQNWNLTPIGTITHPSGVTGVFTTAIWEHGRTNVPLSCANVFIDASSGAAGNDPNDDVNLFAISYHALSLTSKQLTGPGIPTALWSYTYDSPSSVHLYPGTTYDWPVCSGAQCHLPPCSSDHCAGFITTTVSGPDSHWERHRFGNSFRYNEGKLVSVETGSGPANILRKTDYQYDYARSGRPYPVAFGDSLRIFTDSNSNEFIRPVVKTTIEQQGRQFVFEVVSDCWGGGQYCFDAYVRPAKIMKSSTP